jgi:CBS domain containing-hemolysin-like protein
LLRELVGDVFGDQEPRDLQEGAAADLVEATGATPTEEIAARFQVELPEEVETIGGLLARAAGRIPQAGERYVPSAVWSSMCWPRRPRDWNG